MRGLVFAATFANACLLCACAQQLPPEIPPGWPLVKLSFPADAVRHPFAPNMQKNPDRPICSQRARINGEPGWMVGFQTDQSWDNIVKFYDAQAAVVGMKRATYSNHEADKGSRVSIASWEGEGYYLRVDHRFSPQRTYLLPPRVEPEFDGFTLMLYENKNP